MTANINDVSDYIIAKLTEVSTDLSVLKLQKLLYYTQAWHLAIEHEKLFDGSFEAWIHGPVNKTIYNRFARNKYMYSPISISDSMGGADNLNIKQKRAIDNVLEVYAEFSGNQLEDMTHQEDPWLRTRGSLHPSERCELEISEQLMGSYYAQRLTA